MKDIPVSFRSATQKFVPLSVTEAKLVAGVIVAQEMLYMYHSLESMKLKIELPMDLDMDNSRVIDNANSWIVGGRTRHVDGGCM